MPRPVTLFTGQWADLPLADLAQKAKSWGYDGLELACRTWSVEPLAVESIHSSYFDDIRQFLARRGALHFV